MRLWSVVALILCAPLSARASSSNVGQNTAEFLTIGAGARALGMGEAYGPIAEGPEAIYWNPAGLAQMRRAEISYSDTQLYGVMQHDFIAYAQPVASLGGALAASFTSLFQQSLPVVTNSNVQIGNFTPHSDAFALAYAHAFLLGRARELEEDQEYYSKSEKEQSLRGALMLGVSAKGIFESIYEYSASALTFDAGALLRPPSLPQLSVSAVVRNAVGRERFNQESARLPTEADFGVAFDQWWDSARLIPAVEAALPYYGSPYAKFGVECSKPLGQNFSVAVRAGYKTVTTAELGFLSGLTFGAGFQYRRLQADFGFEPMANLGGVYRMTIGWRW